MSIIEPQRRDVIHPKQIKRNSSALRLWHWLNALVITGSLLTVLLNSTLLKTRNNANLIKSNLQASGVNVTDGQAHSVAHVLSDKVWLIHTYIGYSLAALLLFRLLLEFFQVTDQKFLRKLKSTYRQYRHIKQQPELARYEFWVKTIYAVFYLMLITMVLTGLCLAFKDDVPLLKAIHAIKKIHSFTMYLIIAFIIVHIAGVLLAERKDGPGIVSDMINGGKD
jgi:Ni/Fe-hydrogenase 1 B-type cytochrome subunit